MRSTVLALASLILPAAVWAQATGEGPWELPPIWWPLAALAALVLLLIVFGWAFLNLAPLILGIAGAVIGIRWLVRTTARSRSDPAVCLLRERYARGEITREEFEAKRRDLETRHD
jgi:uncharacterized membrane protein